MKAIEILKQLPKREFLDQDFYKFTMLWFVMNHFPNAVARYEFIDRRNHKYPKGLGEVLKQRIETFKDIKLSKEHRIKFQNKVSFLPNLFFDFLEGYRLDPSEVSINQKESGELSIAINGFQYRTILWEVILMSEISEINYLMTGEKPTKTIEELNKQDIDKGVRLHENDVNFVDFGTRRRYSFKNQDRVIENLKIGGKSSFQGTSNCFFGIKYDVRIVGTMAHEIICEVGAILGYAHANKHLMEMWNKTFNGNLGSILTDSYGVASFLRDFDSYQSRIWDSVRHDSGNPKLFTRKMIEHYENLGIDPMSKTIIFSDGLNVDTVIELSEYCKGKIKTSFGVGTHFSNDTGVQPLNIVIKLFKIDNKHVIKLSEVAGKHVGDNRTIELVKELIDY